VTGGLVSVWGAVARGWLMPLTGWAAIALEILPMLEEEAKKRQIEHGNTAPGRKKTLKEKIPEVFQGTQARDHAASIMSVNPRYVSDAKKLQLESACQIDKLKTLTGADGKRYPAEMPRQKPRRTARRR